MKPKVVDKTKNKIEKPEFITFMYTFGRHLHCIIGVHLNS